MIGQIQEVVQDDWSKIQAVVQDDWSKSKLLFKMIGQNPSCCSR
jgi:hypothetical protein